MNILVALGMLFLVIAIPSCSAISMQKAIVTRDEGVSASERQMLSAYKKRADLIGNLVAVAQKSLGAESQVITDVVKARASATQITLPAGATQEDLNRFAQAQQQLSGALGRLLAVSEAYPQLQSVAQFATVQKELANVEGQCAAARNQYIKEVAAYNVNVRAFPNSLVAGFIGAKTKPQLQFQEDEKALQAAPKI